MVGRWRYKSVVGLLVVAVDGVLVVEKGWLGAGYGGAAVEVHGSVDGCWEEIGEKGRN